MSGKFFERVGLGLGDFADAVFITQHVNRFLIENLKSGPLGLLENVSTIFGVGIVSEIGSFINKTFALDIHDDAERIGVFLVGLSYREVTEGRGVQVPRDGVTAAPVAIGLGADIERHLDAVTRVVRSAADFREFPARTQVPAAHLGVRLETTRCQNHPVGFDFIRPIGTFYFDACHAAHRVRDQTHCL